MTIKFDVLNRFTGELQFTANINCKKNESVSLKLGLAVKWAIENSANLYGANLAGANLAGANLAGANLAGANLRSTDLYGANLYGANLGGANLYGANLGSANLAGANLRSTDLYGASLDGANLDGANLARANLGDTPIIDGGLRSDGYRFFLTNFKEEGLRVKAGCRNFALADARDHWTVTRGDTPLGAETFAIIDHMVKLAAIRGWTGI